MRKGDCFSTEKRLTLKGSFRENFQCYVFLFFSFFFVFVTLSSPQINLPTFSFGAHGEASMSTAGGLELGMSEEGQS